MKYNDNGEYKDIYVKAFDTLPIGTEVDYDGNSVPDGWTEITNLYENSVSNVSISSGTTYSNITDCSITAPKTGIALVITHVDFYANATGMRTIGVSINESTVSPYMYVRTNAVSEANQLTALTFAKIISIEKDDVICPRAGQTSGSSLAGNYNIQLIYL